MTVGVESGEDTGREGRGMGEVAGMLGSAGREGSGMGEAGGMLDATTCVGAEEGESDALGLSVTVGLVVALNRGRSEPVAEGGAPEVAVGLSLGVAVGVAVRVVDSEGVGVGVPVCEEVCEPVPVTRGDKGG